MLPSYLKWGDYRWLKTYPDVKLNELKKMAFSQIGFADIPAWKRWRLGFLVAVLFLAELVTLLNVLWYASSLDQVLIVADISAGGAIWFINREAKRRRGLLEAILAEPDRRN